MSCAVAALIAFSVQAAYGGPARSTQTVRALRCCSQRCDHAKTPAAAGHCCGVGGAESELGVSPQTKLPDTGPAMHAVPVEFDAVSRLDSDGTGWNGAIPEARARSEPLFLLTHSLRI
jgi:hypothetical protein